MINTCATLRANPTKDFIDMKALRFTDEQTDAQADSHIFSLWSVNTISEFHHTLSRSVEDKKRTQSTMHKS